MLMSNATDPDALDRLSIRRGVDIRSPLLATLVDLYLQKPFHTPEEERHFTELTLRLLGEADAPMRRVTAARLMDYPATPAPVLQWLAVNAGEPEPVAAAATPRAAIASEPPSASELSDLFFSSSAEERRLILVSLAYVPVQPAATLPMAQMGEAARQLEMAALGRNPHAVMRIIEQSLAIAPEATARIVRDPSGEPIVVVGKTLGVAPDALQRILLVLNPTIGRSVQRVYELAALFETIEVDAARALVSIWRAAYPRTAPAHRPLHPDQPELKPRRPASLPAEPRAHDIQPVARLRGNRR